jgi:hypothetical protein
VPLTALAALLVAGAMLTLLAREEAEVVSEPTLSLAGD